MKMGEVECYFSKIKVKAEIKSDNLVTCLAPERFPGPVSVIIQKIRLNI